MSVYSKIARFLSAKSNRRRPCSHPTQVTSYSLEQRRLLAGITLETATGDLYVAGAGGNDVGLVERAGPNQVKASLSGFESKFFDNSDVNRIVFLGFGGDDQFTNETSIDSLQIGGDGNDTLVGGSGFDQINGGRGNDSISGRRGNDRLIGSFGNDTISGGIGNDEVFGTAGINELYGDEDDDIIFGGNEVDTIFGGSGVDRIYALGGDDILYAGSGGVAGTSGIAQADLILGLDGNDTFYGGPGLNVFYGGSGNDTFQGANGAENRLSGQAGNDVIYGGDQDDFLVGGSGEDSIRGNDGNDYIIPGAGNDSVWGGGNRDTIAFIGNYREHRINDVGALVIRDLRDTADNQGIDTIRESESFRYANGSRPAESPIEQVVTINPIVVSNDNGSQTAQFFGPGNVHNYIINEIDNIFYQANIDIAWYPKKSWNSTFANRGNGGTRPDSDLESVLNQGDQAGVGSPNNLVIDLYFVNIVPVYGATTENQVNGLALIGEGGAMVHIGDNLLDFQSGRDTIARVVAHELAHNLGLGYPHSSDPDNLMHETPTNDELTQPQINTMLASNLSR